MVSNQPQMSSVCLRSQQPYNLTQGRPSRHARYTSQRVIYTVVYIHCCLTQKKARNEHAHKVDHLVEGRRPELGLPILHPSQSRKGQTLHVCNTHQMHVPRDHMRTFPPPNFMQTMCKEMWSANESRTRA